MMHDFKELHEFVLNVIHDGLLVLIWFLFDESILHSRTNVPKGESIVKPQKFQFPKTPLASLFYRGRMVFLGFLYLPDVVWRIRGHICDQRKKSSGSVPSEKI